MFDEKTLYEEIIKTWGEHGAHADVYRALCTRASVSLTEDELTSDMVRRIYKEENNSKIQTIKRVRWEHGLTLKAAKDLVEQYI